MMVDFYNSDGDFVATANVADSVWGPNAAALTAVAAAKGLSVTVPGSNAPTLNVNSPNDFAVAASNFASFQSEAVTASKFPAGRPAFGAQHNPAFGAQYNPAFGGRMRPQFGMRPRFGSIEQAPAMHHHTPEIGGNSKSALRVLRKSIFGAVEQAPDFHFHVPDFGYQGRRLARRAKAAFGIGTVIPSAGATALPGGPSSFVSSDMGAMALAGGAAALVAKGLGAGLLGTATAAVGGLAFGAYVVKEKLGA